MIRAVLFDYGGVVGEVIKPDGGPMAMAAEICDVLDRAGASIPLADVHSDFKIGMRAYEGWKRAQSRRREPREITHREFWDLVACDWSERARAVVLASATPLVQHLELTMIKRPARADSAMVLRTLRDAGVRTGIVCNCLSGAAARQQLRLDGLDKAADVEIYSDELGQRKPGPAIAHAALAALGVAPQDAWLVGDRIDRDILAARRAGLAAAVLVGPPQAPVPCFVGFYPTTKSPSLVNCCRC